MHHPVHEPHALAPIGQVGEHCFGLVLLMWCGEV